MKIFNHLKDIKSEKIIIRLSLYMTIVGLFVMEHFHKLASWGMILLAVFSILYYFIQKPKLKFKWSPLFSPFLCIYLILMISLLFTHKENYHELNHYFEKRLLFLALPLSFIILPTFDKKYYLEVFGLFFTLCVITSLVCTIDYFLHASQINETYTFSGTLKTPIHHVRYSLFICYAIFLGIYILRNIPEHIQRYRFLLNSVLIASIVFELFFLHLLAVRSGLLAFYSIAGMGILYFILKKKYSYLLYLSVGLGFLIYFSLQNLETLKGKIGYTLYDLDQSKHIESQNNYSLSRRMVSSKIAIELFRENPFLGTGEANLRTEMDKKYKANYPHIFPQNYLSPHNQFLTILASLGLLGFLLFFSCLYFPLFYSKNYRHFPLLIIYIILTISFLTEDTLQSQLGYMFGLFFIMLNLHMLKPKPE